VDFELGAYGKPLENLQQVQGYRRLAGTISSWGRLDAGWPAFRGCDLPQRIMIIERREAKVNYRRDKRCIDSCLNTTSLLPK
jgi:hypothetical protein